MARGYASLVGQDARGFHQHPAAVIDAGGQKVSAMDRLYLAERMPVLIIWGDSDPIIPVEHGRARPCGDPAQPPGRDPRRPSLAPARPAASGLHAS